MHGFKRKIKIKIENATPSYLEAGVNTAQTGEGTSIVWPVGSSSPDVESTRKTTTLSDP
jgi:hypothetical protein